MRRAFAAVICSAAVSGCLTSPASANVPHTVQPGETLWSIAAANGFTTRALAAANGLSVDSQVVLGSTIQIPSVSEAASALSGTNPATAQLSSAPAGGPAPAPMGGYTVRPGDTLSGIAARSGVSASQIAYMNGLNPRGVLLAGTAIKLPTGAPAPSSPAPAAPRVVPQAAPSPTPGRVTSSEVGQIAASHGVPGSLASAIAWQESGFNNGMVSSANARGVMQVMPGTWDWVKRNLAGGQQLNPKSALDNVTAGSLYLGSLLRSTGGDPGMAAAAYYQGLGSVQSRGVLPETQRYVDNVMALRSRFGGP
jgi:soluble lytic murein transglycosylase-like protein